MSDSTDPILDRLDELLAELRSADDSVRREAGARCEAFLAGLRERAVTAGATGVPEWHGLIGDSPPIRAMHKLIERFAKAQPPVLIRGESGTGKELVARLLHDLGPRRSRPFVAENCAAIPETLLESVLFGHVRGSFTGAVKDHKGHFVEAHGGTLFLDEIGDMSLPMQAKLLRTLQEGEVRPVGGEKVRKVDVRVVAATHRDLAAMVEEGSFRSDLWFRLDVLTIAVPPLRDRGDDVLHMARHFLAKALGRAGRPTMPFTAEAESAIRSATWPGNVRQLQNEMQRLAALCDGPEVGIADLSPEVVSGP